jgi:undecaprenyl phosphate N,N'-diacetylbacillosamine 1-phosphate transferase
MPARGGRPDADTDGDRENTDTGGAQQRADAGADPSNGLAPDASAGSPNGLAPETETCATQDPPVGVPPISRTLWARGGKRVFDLVFATILLILVSPLLLAAGLAVRISSPGPIFFRQDRVGREGRIFKPFKFRTMRAGRRADPRELVPLDHAEITRLGFFLRRFKIDELPQILNVFNGDMSLVGPRPLLPVHAEGYDDFRRQRLLVRPGISGLAQVNGNTAITWDHRILYDIAYVRCCSLGLDLAIFFRTFAVVFQGEDHTTREFYQTRWSKLVSPPAGYDIHSERF